MLTFGANPVTGQKSKTPTRINIEQLACRSAENSPRKPEKEAKMPSNRPRDAARQTKNGAPKVPGRTRHFKRRDPKTGAIIEYAITPEASLSWHEKRVKPLAMPSSKPHPVNREDGLPILWWTNSPYLRYKKAHGHVLAIHKITGETPPEIMTRLGLTDEEIAHIGPFHSKTVWF
jgi:hypothetical protein